MRGSVAVSFDGKVLLHNELSNGQRSAQSLVPTIQTLLSQVDWPVKSLDAIAVALGPGSFTGLRVGLATARMLAYAVGAKLIGVNTLQTIAANLCDIKDSKSSKSGITGQSVTTAVDAQRGNVSAQTFQLIPSRSFPGDLFPEPVDELRLLTLAAWWALANDDETLSFAGPILFKIADNRPATVHLLDDLLWSPNAIGVSRIAWERLFSGESDDFFALQPYYSRPSAAEEKKLAGKS